MEGIGDGLGGAIIACCLVSILAFWGVYELVDWLFVFDGIKSPVLLTPEIELVIKDGVVDTLYVYHK